MAFILLVAILVLGAAFLITRTGASPAHFDWSSTPSSKSNNSGGAINPATGLPMISGEAHGFDVAGNAYGFDDRAWDLSHHDTIDGALDDFGTGVQDTGWPSDSMAPWGMDHMFGNDTTASHDFTSNIFCINPATGLPMVSDSMVGFDLGGNAYGTSNDILGHDDVFGSGTGIDSHGFSDSFNSAGSDTDWT